MTDHKGLPVHGYQSQSDEKVAMVNHNKQMEEALLRGIEAMQGNPEYDQRDLALAKTHLEDAFMRWNRAIFRPQRIKLESDHEV